MLATYAVGRSGSGAAASCAAFCADVLRGALVFVPAVARVSTGFSVADDVVGFDAAVTLPRLAGLLLVGTASLFTSAMGDLLWRRFRPRVGCSSSGSSGDRPGLAAERPRRGSGSGLGSGAGSGDGGVGSAGWPSVRLLLRDGRGMILQRLTSVTYMDKAWAARERTGVRNGQYTGNDTRNNPCETRKALVTEDQWERARHAGQTASGNRQGTCARAGGRSCGSRRL